MEQPYEGWIVKVALPARFRLALDYLPPEGMLGVPQPGLRVRVPVGRTRAIGFVVGSAERSTLPASALKHITEIIDPEPLWDPVSFELLCWAAGYYHHPLGQVLSATVPAGIRDGQAATAEVLNWQLSTAGIEALAAGPRGKKQRALLELLRAGPMEADQLSAEGHAATLRSLNQKGWLESFLAPATPPPAGAGNALPPPLNSAQQKACDQVTASLGRYATWLLHGVTGSGKTEVYLQVITQVLARGRSALVLVPEIGLTPQLVERFRARLTVPVVTLNSSMTDTERLAAWRAARSGAARVVIGTRSAVFAPLPKLGILVVDEEHDASYKQQEGFRYSARDLAVARAGRTGIPVVLGSATPSLESLANVAAGRYQRLLLPERAGKAVRPAIAVVDLRRHAARDGLSQPAVAAIGRHLEAGGQVLVYLNRRGYAPTMFCTSCGWMAACRHCDARMTVHLKDAMLTCHHCGANEPMAFACGSCGGELRPVGQGTERVEAALAQLFPAAPQVRLDRDSVRKRGEIDKALARVASGEARILLGTQMLTKGHDYPGVTLVVVLDADQGLFGIDFRSSERLAQQIVQVAGRAGRGERRGEVLIQSAFPENPLLVSLVQEGYTAFARAALKEREAASWPPFARLALLRADATQRESVFGFLDRARSLTEDLGPDVRVLGPAAAAMERRAGRYRGQLLVESAQRASLQRMLSIWLQRLAQLKTPGGLRWSMDVDPLELD
ncbi:MAG: primosomal protein N' [Steroidobacteraceae bacterium]